MLATQIAMLAMLATLIATLITMLATLIATLATLIAVLATLIAVLAALTATLAALSLFSTIAAFERKRLNMDSIHKTRVIGWFWEGGCGPDKCAREFWR